MEKNKIRHSKIRREIIGNRAGEKIHEQLVSTFEQFKTYETSDYYLIMPDEELMNKPFSDRIYPKMNKVINHSDFSSETAKKLTKSEIRNLLNDSNLIF